MISKAKRQGIWGLWAIFWPLILIFIYYNFPVSAPIDYPTVFSFVLLGIIVALFPITLNNTPVFLVNSVSLATFLIFGLGVEMIVTQIAILTVIFRLKINKNDIFRIPLNLLMFSIISLLGAIVYYLFEDMYFLGRTDLLGIFGYAVIVFVANQALLKIIQISLYNRKVKIFDEEFYFSLMMNVYMIPIALILVYMYEAFGVAGIYVVGIPIISVSISIKMYYASKTINVYLQSANQIAQKLTGHLNRSDVVDTYLTDLPEIFPISCVAVYDVQDQNNVQLIRSYEKESGIVNKQVNISLNNQSVLVEARDSDQMISVSTGKGWKDRVPEHLREMGESLVATPVKRNQEIVSIIVLVAKQKHAYDGNLLVILKVLNNYLGIALENAKHYEESQAEGLTDHLTGLPNFRFIEQTIATIRNQQQQACMLDIAATVEEQIEASQSCSLILLDLDRFKKVNDTYGHECGNEVLQKLANRMKDFIGDRGCVARYGGEEFLVFLPNSIHKEGFQIAEDLRQIIAGEPFSCVNHMDADREKVDIHLTASLGIASYPDHCDDPMELVRLADRTMYVGAKHNGRNKVSAYQ